MKAVRYRRRKAKLVFAVVFAITPLETQHVIDCPAAGGPRRVGGWKSVPSMRQHFATIGVRPRIKSPYSRFFKTPQRQLFPKSGADVTLHK